MKATASAIKSMAMYFIMINFVSFVTANLLLVNDFAIFNGGLEVNKIEDVVYMIGTHN